MIGEQLRRGAAMDDAAAFEDDGGLRERQRDIGVLLTRGVPSVAVACQPT